MATTPAQKTPPLSPREDVEQLFRRLELKWRTETQFLSDPARIMGHPAIRSIIALGEEAIPIILRDLQVNGSLMVWALSEITGENPAPPKIDNGFLKWDVKAQIEAWLQWGRDKGFL